MRSLVIKSHLHGCLAESIRPDEVAGDEDHRIHKADQGDEMTAMGDRDDRDTRMAESGRLPGNSAGPNKAHGPNSDSQSLKPRNAEPQKHGRGQENADPAHVFRTRRWLMQNIFWKTNADRKE